MKILNLEIWNFFMILIPLILFANLVKADNIPKSVTIDWIENLLSNKTKREWLPVAKDKKSQTFIAPASISYSSDVTTLDMLSSINIIEKKLESGSYIMATAIYNCDNKTFKITDIRVFDLSGNIRHFKDTDFLPLKNHEKNERIADFICPRTDKLPIL